jgi:hypothetical protein
VSNDSAYKAARTGQIPGCFAIGRLYRVNWSAFVERSGLAGGHELAEEVGGVPVSTFDHVGVDPKRRGGIGMT